VPFIIILFLSIFHTEYEYFLENAPKYMEIVYWTV